MGGRWSAETRSFLSQLAAAKERGLNKRVDGDGHQSSRAQQFGRWLSRCWVWIPFVLNKFMFFQLVRQKLLPASRRSSIFCGVDQDRQTNTHEFRFQHGPVSVSRAPSTAEHGGRFAIVANREDQDQEGVGEHDELFRELDGDLRTSCFQASAVRELLRVMGFVPVSWDVLTTSFRVDRQFRDGDLFGRLDG